MAKITIREFGEAVKFNLDNKIKRALLGLGPSGIGKSAIMEQIAKERKMGLIDLRLLLYTETELKGIPFPAEDNKSTVWLHNDILPNEKRDGKKGILLIEELTSASKRVQAAAYQLIYDRKLGSYTMPEGWYIVALGNQRDDNGVFAGIPAPLANRFEIHEISYDLDCWKEDFAYKNGVNTDVIAYLNFKPSAFHNFNPEVETFTFASPRSWTAVSDILNIGKLDFKSRLLKAKISANIGEIEANSFIEFMKKKESLDIVDDVLEGKDVDIPKGNDVTCIVLGGIVSKFKDLPKYKREMPDEVFNKFENAVNFILKMSPEFIAIGFKDLAALNKPLVQRTFMEDIDSNELREFMRHNKYLLA